MVTLIRPDYLTTNELLEPIVRGLELSKSNNVLSIGGSGDQAFAILELAGKVLVVDSDDKQVLLIKERMCEIENGEFDVFLSHHHPSPTFPVMRKDSRTNYFKKPGRLEAIRSKIGSMSLKYEDIFDVASKGGFDRAYLSNALTYHTEKNDIEYLSSLLNMVSSPMPVGGLIYTSDNINPLIADDLEIASDIMEKIDNLDKRWSPTVYRKI